MKSREHNLKKTLLIIAIVLIVSFFVAMGVSIQRHRVTLDNVSKVCYSDGSIVAVNLSDTSANIVQFDTKGVELGEVSYRLTSGDSYEYVSELISYGSSVYAHILALDTTNGLVQSDRVELCNFSSEKLESVWSIPCTGDTFESVAKCTTIVGGNLYYIATEDTTATLYSLDSTGVSTVVYSATLPTCDLTQWYISSSLEMVACSTYGGVYTLGTTTSTRVYPITDGYGSLVDFSLFEDSLYFTDLTTNQSVTYSLGTDSLEYGNAPHYSNVDTTSLRGVQYIGDDTYIAVCNSKGSGDSVAICSGSRAEFLNGITYNFSVNVAFVRWLVLSSIVLLLLVFAVDCYIHSERYISIGVKVLVIFSVAFVVAIPTICHSIESNVRDNLLDTRYNDMYIDCANRVHDYGLNELADALEDFSTPSEGLYYSLDVAFYSENITDIQGRNARSESLLKPQYYAYHVLNTDGTLVTVKTAKAFENVPTEYLYDSSTVEYYMESIDTQTVLKTTITTDLGECYVLACPMGSTIVELGFEKYLIDSEVSGYMHHFKVILGAIIVGVFIAFIAVLMLSLRPVRVLLKKIKSDYFTESSAISKRVPTNEILEINDVFEGMMVNIHKSQLEMERNNQTYSQFEPSEILSMLYGSNDILQSKANDSCQRMLYTMQIGLTDLPKDTFNTSLDTLITLLKQHNGIVEYFNLHYMDVFFEDSPKDILETALELLHTLDGNVSVALSYGVCIPSILGANNRLEALIVSKHKRVTERLLGISKRFGIGLLVSEDFYEKVSLLQGFELCLIGNIMVCGEYTRVYSVLNATTPTDGLSHAKEDFENGVQLFLDRNFTDAERYFVSVLRYNSSNAIAKEYLKMCETYTIDSSNVNTDIL